MKEFMLHLGARVLRFLSVLPHVIKDSWVKSKREDDKPLKCVLGFHRWDHEGFLHCDPYPHSTPLACFDCYHYKDDDK